LIQLNQGYATNIKMKATVDNTISKVDQYEMKKVKKSQKTEGKRGVDKRRSHRGRKKGQKRQTD